MTEHNETIAAAYNAGTEEEYHRLGSSPLREFEFYIVCKTIEGLLKKNAVIVDIGSGPGRYAEHFLERGHSVGLIDLSAKSLKAFSDRINNSYSHSILFNKVSCATTLGWVANSFADCILLMGPMYHLANATARETVLRHCHRILKPGGILATIYMSPYPKLNPLLECTAYELSDANYINNLLNEGLTYTNFNGFKVPQYRCWPTDANCQLEQAGFTCKNSINIEGIASHFACTDMAYYAEPQTKSQLFAMLEATCSLKELLGITHQYLVVATKHE